MFPAPRILAWILLPWLAALAQNGAVWAQDVKVETVLDDLHNPCGVVVQPGTGHVFVADSGRGRVLRLVDGKVEDVVTGLPQDEYGKGPTYKIGPLGLAFLDGETLIVGGGGLTDGQDLLRIYTVPAAGAEPLSVADMKEQFSLPGEQETPGEGNFYGVAASRSAIFVTCNGDDAKGWIAKADVRGTKIGPFQRFIPTKEAVGVDAPVAITISPQGHLAVGQMGEIDVAGDGLLTFYSTGGEPLLNLPTGLHDMTGLAYSDKTGSLYALDFAWRDPAQGGLFRLDRKLEGVQIGVSSTRIVALDKPTALAFADDGTLYITVLGTAEDNAQKQPGKLLKIAPGL